MKAMSLSFPNIAYASTGCYLCCGMACVCHWFWYLQHHVRTLCTSVLMYLTQLLVMTTPVPISAWLVAVQAVNVHQ